MIMHCLKTSIVCHHGTQKLLLVQLLQLYNKTSKHLWDMMYQQNISSVNSFFDLIPRLGQRKNPPYREASSRTAWTDSSAMQPLGPLGVDWNIVVCLWYSSKFKTLIHVLKQGVIELSNLSMIWFQLTWFTLDLVLQLNKQLNKVYEIGWDCWWFMIVYFQYFGLDLRSMHQQSVFPYHPFVGRSSSKKIGEIKDVIRLRLKACGLGKFVVAGYT